MAKGVKNKLLFLILFLIFVGFFVFEYLRHQPPEVLPFEDVIVDTGLDNEKWPALVEPKFESVPLADIYLQDEGLGILLFEGTGEGPSTPRRRSGSSRELVRFYPFQILVWHNLVNDVYGGADILVAYDPLCGSAEVFERMTGEIFENSGKVINGALEIDRTNLVAKPAAVTTWQSFKKNFPNGLVLSRTTGFDRDYSRDPYENYSETPAVWYPLKKYDATYQAKTVVYGFGDEVFPLDNIKNSEKISGLQTDFIWDEELETVRGYGKDGVEIPLTRAYWFCWINKVGN